MSTPAAKHSAELVQALGRLELSRARLRHEMIPPPPPPDEPGRGPFAWPRRARALWRRLRQRSGRWPVASLAMTALGEWWHHHPWRPAGEMLVDEVKGAALPVIRRHPVVVVALAAGLGAAVVAGRPWRWPVVAARMRPMPGHMGRWALRQLTSPSVQAALLSLLVVLRRPEHPEPEPAPPPHPSSEPQPPRQPSPTQTSDGG